MLRAGMVATAPVTRRLLLRRFGAGSSLFGTFLLSQAHHAALATKFDGVQVAGSGGARPGQAQPHKRIQERTEPKQPPPLVMLDPGHGGKDPGAVGISGTFEKQVSLATALELRRQLMATGRYRVELTRTTDTFVALDDRVYQAQRRGAALFVSMHADALSDHTIRGASVYTLAPTASDAQTAALARRENSADRFIGRRWQGASPEVSRILASLVRQETRSGSVRLARDLVGSLDQDLPMLQNPDRHAGFVVLKAADIPSVLVEMGFMSNARDEAALRRPDHRKLVAQSMHRAVDAYFIGMGHMAIQDGRGTG
jgi:N-acetylmuramoyl-L-alanine amidase